MQRITAVLLIVSFLIGAAAGAYGSYYRFVAYPQRQAKALAYRQQQELNKMVRHGSVVAVNPDTIQVRIDKSDKTDDVGKMLTFHTNEYTTIQIGMSFVSKSEQKSDLTAYFQKDDQVDLLVQGDQAVAIHREYRPGELGKGAKTQAP